MSKHRLGYTAHLCASAAVSRGLLEKTFHKLVDPIVDMRKNDQKCGACVPIPVHRDTKLAMRVQNTRLLHATMSPISRHTTRMLLGMFSGIGPSHTERSSSPYTTASLAGPQHLAIDELGAPFSPFELYHSQLHGIITFTNGHSFFFTLLETS